MSIINYLVVPKGAKKNSKRRGRGQGSGHGKTACRGHKGQKAHGKTKKDKGFEGGQMPLARRLPKRGFINKFRKEYQIVNVKSLDPLPEESIVNPYLLKEKGLIKKASLPVKILSGGKLQKKFEVHAHAFSQKAREAIEEAKGKIVIIKVEG